MGRISVNMDRGWRNNRLWANSALNESQSGGIESQWIQIRDFRSWRGVKRSKGTTWQSVELVPILITDEVLVRTATLYAYTYLSRPWRALPRYCIQLSRVHTFLTFSKHSSNCSATMKNMQNVWAFVHTITTTRTPCFVPSWLYTSRPLRRAFNQVNTSVSSLNIR